MCHMAKACCTMYNSYIEPLGTTTFSSTQLIFYSIWYYIYIYIYIYIFGKGAICNKFFFDYLHWVWLPRVLMTWHRQYIEMGYSSLRMQLREL